jgi:hypothetical protein
MSDAELIDWIGVQLERNNLMFDGRGLILGNKFFYGPDPHIDRINFKAACLQAAASQSDGEAKHG